MKAIVAVDLNWGIGYRGQLLQRIPGDMKHFREKTIGKVVVMGRGTFDSLPGQKPLEKRVNIVLSRDKEFKENCNKKFSDEKLLVCNSLEELFSELNRYNRDDVYVIGGESIYNQLLPYCSEAYVTKIEKTYPADKYFINLDQEADWVLAEAGETLIYDAVPYRFCRYEKVSS
ncbi:MAG TPA: dihydrofolate reductase [Peptococcaceae bacterium]|nr:dihydrofolate reductase [Peptococcaceae bacterium]